jgi:hypothetical protein
MLAGVQTKWLHCGDRFVDRLVAEKASLVLLRVPSESPLPNARNFVANVVESLKVLFDERIHCLKNDQLACKSGVDIEALVVILKQLKFADTAVRLLETTEQSLAQQTITVRKCAAK